MRKTRKMGRPLPRLTPRFAVIPHGESRTKGFQPPPSFGKRPANWSRPRAQSPGTVPSKGGKGGAAASRPSPCSGARGEEEAGRGRAYLYHEAGLPRSEPAPSHGIAAARTLHAETGERGAGAGGQL
ncbi:Hypothetical predicted protein [Podarcis lilfordi]|uniref:Uncharacterized protein n=1 Tax=Podarcis lilfordi TaxID=74358 RepID=A0AA35K3C0_9SAUR|nr:Hypothetical predicted protein [Podarcis lilfordi]